MARFLAFASNSGVKLPRTRASSSASCKRSVRSQIRMASLPAAARVLRNGNGADSRSELRKAEELLSAKGFEPLKDRVVVFDGVCVMCNGGVDFLLKWDTAKQFKYAALQSDAGQALALKYDAPRDLSTMIYIEGEKAHVRSEAVLRIGARLFALAPAARFALIAVPKPMRDWFYSNVIAKNRYDIFGKREECRLVDPGQEDRFL